jgi:hypothetical protein
MTFLKFAAKAAALVVIESINWTGRVVLRIPRARRIA